MAPTKNALDMIATHESGWRNVITQAWNPSTGFNQSTGTVTAPSTASGYWQITNSTWRSYAPGAGVDISQYPTAMSAPYDTQRQVAGSIYDKRGFADWAPYNPSIRNDLRTYGAGDYGSDSEIPSADPKGLSNSGYRPAYDNFSPSGYDYSGDAAPGSFNDKFGYSPEYKEGNFNVSGEVKNGSFGDFGSQSIGNTANEDGTESAPSFSTDPKQGMSADDYIQGENVSKPDAGSQGSPSDVPTAIVTASNQEAKTTASAAKTTAEATLKAANTTAEAQKAQTTNETKLQGEQQGFVANWAVRIFLFIVGAIFIGGGLFLFGGQTIFQTKEAT